MIYVSNSKYVIIEFIPQKTAESLQRITDFIVVHMSLSVDC